MRTVYTQEDGSIVFFQTRGGKEFGDRNIRLDAETGEKVALPDLFNNNFIEIGCLDMCIISPVYFV